MEVTQQAKYRQTEVGKIPVDWTLTPIGELTNTSSGGTPSRQDPKYFKGDIPWVKTGELGEKYLYDTEEKITKEAVENSSAKVFPPETLLVAMYGATIGKMSISKVPLSSNQACCAIFNSENFSTEYLYYALSFRKRNLISKGAGGAQPNISQKLIKVFKVPLPPLSEQRKIAEILSTVDEQIAATQAVIKETEELKRGLMQELFTRGIGHTRFKETKIGRVPEEWEVKRFNKIVELSQYGLSLATTDDGIYPMFKMNNFQNGKMSSMGVDKVTLSTKELKKYRLEKGDILFNRTNSIDLVGKTGLFDLEGDYVFASYLIRFKIDRKAVLPEFVNYYFNWSYIQAKLKNLATKGASQANISATVLKKFFVIPLPKVEEQRKIVKILSEIDVKLEQERKRKAELEELKRGLMQALLTGKVRVKV